MADEQLIYSSENGDRWVLVHEFGTASAIVRHFANLAAGGQVTDTPVDEFLSRGKSSPERAALCRLLRERKPDA